MTGTMAEKNSLSSKQENNDDKVDEITIRKYYEK